MSIKANKNCTLETTAVLSDYTAQILSDQKYSKIHSVFPNGFNLDYEGYLIYVTYHQEGQLSALGMTINRKSFDQLHPQLKVGQLVRYQKNRFTFYIQANNLSIAIQKRLIKNLKINNYSIEASQWFQLKDYLNKKSLLASSGFSTRARLLNTYQNILRKKEVSEDQVRDLIGAGIGLTPTGDDFLQGLILMEKALGDSPDIEVKVKRQLEERSTTDVSVSYYKALFEGYYNEALAKLFKAISEENEKEIKKSILLLQDYGATSGFDLLTGMLTYLQIQEE